MKSILIVEDDPTLRELLFELFSGQYHSVAAKSAEEALSLLEGENFNVVVTDISMSGMSGLELLGHVRQRWPQTTVIVVSGIRDKEYAEGLLKMGAFEYMVKPFDLMDMYLSMARAMKLHEGSAEEEQPAAERPAECPVPDPAGKEEEPAEVFSSIQLDKIFALADLLEMVQRSRMNGYVCLSWDKETVEEARATGRFNDASGKFDEAISHRAATIYLRDGLMIDAMIADSESDPFWRDAEQSLATVVRLSTWARVGLRAWGFSTSDMRRTPKLSVTDNSGKLFGIITSDEESWDESGGEPPPAAEAEWGRPLLSNLV
ncbi:MAG: response regulator [Acidobacteria bacterium]|nr:response regulator [Acidobacteriota bacterium]